MAYTTINKSTDYFNTKLYTGNFTDNTDITGVGFQPDLVWLKERSNTSSHLLQDAVRGANKDLFSNETSAEESNTNRMKAFISDGFTLGAHNLSNQNGETYASWNWKANGTGSANTTGATASTVSANTTAGFSIVKYTGAGATTYGHGLGATPNMIIIKKLNSADDWFVYHHSIITASSSNKQFMRLNNTNALESNGTAYTFTSVSDTTFGVGTDDKISESGDSFIAYCFAGKQGYSKFGSYTGNGNADGTFVYTGFSPAWVMIKETSGLGSWRIYDSQRPTYNDKYGLIADATDVEETATNRNKIDQLSNGFKLRMQYDDTNGTGGSYIYMAFAEAPLVGSNNTPCTAR